MAKDSHGLPGYYGGIFAEDNRHYEGSLRGIFVAARGSSRSLLIEDE